MKMYFTVWKIKCLPYLKGKRKTMRLLFHYALESVDVFRERVRTPGTQLHKDLQGGQGGATQAQAFH